MAAMSLGLLSASTLLALTPPGPSPHLRTTPQEPPGFELAYYYRGVHYPYHRGGRYYHYHYHGRYCNYRVHWHSGWHCR